MVLFGADCAHRYADLFTGRVALLTGPSGKTTCGRSTIDVLKEMCNLTLLLAPEHGVRGDRAAGELFSDETDPLSGLKVRSLYTKDSKRLSKETLAMFDTLVYDMADVGCRYYTFITTLRYCIEDCAAAGKRMVVLDRPNPLGDRLSGGVLQPGNESFVGGYTLPVCYGLTCGELARMMNGELRCNCDLHVVPCENLNRNMTFRDWGCQWVPPSVGMPRFETALLYPAACLIEGTNLSEGRGTDAPFATIGAPFICAESFAEAFQALACPGITAEPVHFTPTASKHQGVPCGGIRIRVTDEHALPDAAMGVKLLDLLRRMYPREFHFLAPVRQDGRPFISLLAGHRDFEDPDWSKEQILSRYDAQCRAFRIRKADYEWYPKGE